MQPKLGLHYKITHTYNAGQRTQAYLESSNKWVSGGRHKSLLPKVPRRRLKDPNEENDEAETLATDSA